jgi:hypothetical protein
MTDRLREPGESETEASDAELRKSVLKAELPLGAVLIGLGAVEAGSALADVAAVAAMVCLATAAAFYVTEHDLVPGLFPEVVAIVSLLAVAGVVAGAVAFFPAPMPLVLSAALVGFGVGMVGYRTVFGLLRPLPPWRLERARSQRD